MFLSPLNTRDGLYLSHKVIAHLVREVATVLVAPMIQELRFGLSKRISTTSGMFLIIFILMYFTHTC